MILYEIKRYPYLIAQFLRYGLLFLLLFAVLLIFLMFAVKRRNHFVWKCLYAYEIVVFVVSALLNFGQGNHYRLYEVAHIAMWLFLIMIVTSVTIHLIVGNRKWAALYVIEGSILMRCILGVLCRDFVAICLSIAIIGIIFATRWIHCNLKHK